MYVSISCFTNRYIEEAKVLLASSNGTRIMNTLWNAKVHHHGVLGEVWNTTTNGRLTRLGVIRVSMLVISSSQPQPLPCIARYC